MLTNIKLLFVKTDDGTLTLPDSIEFSDRMVLYRRGILKPPAPKEVEFSAQVMPSLEAAKPVRVRWKAKGAIAVSLYRDDSLVPGNFRPSDEYETTVISTSTFRVVADYGNGETAQKEPTVNAAERVSRAREGGAPGYIADAEQPNLWDVKPPIIELDGTVNAVFTGLSDRLSDYKVQGIEALELSVDKVMDYRKLGTAIPLLQRLQPQIDQTATIQTGDRFVWFEYQGAVRGFQSFFTTIGSLLNSPDVQANVNLKISLEFKPPLLPNASELNIIK